MSEAAEREAEGLPDDIERVTRELVQKAIFEVLGDAEGSKGAKIPLFEEGYAAAAERLKALAAESFGESKQAEGGLEYVSPGAFVYDYGRVLVFNRLQRAAFETADVAERVLFLPHCLQNRRRCEAEEHDLYDECARCGACAITNIVNLAEEKGYLPERIFIVGGASVIPPLVDEFKPAAVAGVACMEELGLVVDRIIAGSFLPPAQMALLRRWGCRNTRLELADVKAIL